MLTFHMRSISESFASILILIMATSSVSLLMVMPVSARSIPTPTVPTFTLKFIPASYNVTTTNPYTGVITTTEVDNSTIQVTIKNQPFHYSFNGTTYNLYYNVGTKGHFENDWSGYYSLIPHLASIPVYNTSTSQYSETYAEFIQNNPIQSHSDYTVLSFSAESPPNGPSTTYPPNSQLDFRVQAIIGHNSQYFAAAHIYPPNFGDWYTGIAFDIASGWSSTQTINLANGSVSTSTSTTPTVPEFPILTILLAFILLSLLSIVVLAKKHISETAKIG